MLKFIYSLSDLSLFLMISSIAIGLSIVTTFIIRWIFKPDDLYDANPGTHRVSVALLGIYSILVGFAIQSLFDNLHDAEFVTYHEAKTLENINTYAKDLSEPASYLITEEVKNYARTVINNDWKEMTKGKQINKKSELIIQNIRSIIFQHPESTNTQKMIQNSIFQELEVLYKDRDDRIYLSTKALNDNVLYVCTFIGILSILFSCIGGIRLVLHLVSVSTISLAIASTLFLVIVLDQPFYGPFAITPEPFENILRELNLEQSQ